MKIPSKFKIFIVAVTLALAGDLYANESPWKFEAGLGTRNHTPLVIIGGFSYNSVNFRLQGLGAHNGSRDFWCGIRGSLLWTFFQGSPLKVSVGMGGGYEYAQAPNDMHKAINDANNALYLHPYNYKENADISGEIWTSVYGFYTQISVPIYRFADHDVSKVLWGAGYLVQF